MFLFCFFVFCKFNKWVDLSINYILLLQLHDWIIQGYFSCFTLFILWRSEFLFWVWWIFLFPFDRLIYLFMCYCCKEEIKMDLNLCHIWWTNSFGTFKGIFTHLLTIFLSELLDINWADVLLRHRPALNSDKAHYSLEVYIKYIVCSSDATFSVYC